MLAKTHLVIGLAAAFTMASPGTAGEAIPVVAGAAAGCMICDIDSEGTSHKVDTSIWRGITIAVICAALIADYLTGSAFLGTAKLHWPFLWFGGFAGFLVTGAFASVSSHRGFSHSLTALVLETFSLWLMFPSATMPFATAFISHVILDILNKRPLKLLYPVKKGFCMGLFYADKTADKLFAAAGTVWLLLEVYRCAMLH